MFSKYIQSASVTPVNYDTSTPLKRENICKSAILRICTFHTVLYRIKEMYSLHSLLSSRNNLLSSRVWGSTKKRKKYTILFFLEWSLVFWGHYKVWITSCFSSVWGETNAHNRQTHIQCTNKYKCKCTCRRHHYTSHITYTF